MGQSDTVKKLPEQAVNRREMGSLASELRIPGKGHSNISALYSQDPIDANQFPKLYISIR